MSKTASISAAIVSPGDPTGAAAKLQATGILVSRYGLVIVLLLIGALKFTAEEARGIQPLVTNSPFMSWTYAVLSIQGASNLIGVFEIVTAISIGLRPLSAKVSFAGSLAGSFIFLLTLSFLFSTPGAAHLRYGLPVLGNAGQFLIKDLVLLGASLWTAAEAYSAIPVERVDCEASGTGA